MRNLPCGSSLNTVNLLAKKFEVQELKCNISLTEYTSPS